MLSKLKIGQRLIKKTKIDISPRKNKPSGQKQYNPIRNGCESSKFGESFAILVGRDLNKTGKSQQLNQTLNNYPLSILINGAPSFRLFLANSLKRNTSHNHLFDIAFQLSPLS